MIIVWNAYPDNGAIGYGLNTILDWTSSYIPVAGWTTPTAVHSKCGQEASYPSANAIDDNTGTFWKHQHQCYHWIIFDMGQTYGVTKIRLYQPDTSWKRWGTDQGIDVYVSDDPANLGDIVWTGALNASGWQESGAFSKDGRYIKLVAKADEALQQMNEFDAYCAAAGEESKIPIFMYDYRNMREA